MLMQMSKFVQKLQSYYLYSAAILLVFFGLAHPIKAMVIDDFTVHMQIMELHEARAPFIINGYILLSYDAPKYDAQPRYVAAAFAHEDFRQLHTYSINQHGIYVLVLPVPQDLSEVQYRLCIDSIWINDPGNPAQTISQSNQIFSTITIPAEREKLFSVPEIQADGTLVLRYRGEAGQQVYASGTFNNWDPFMNRMEEESPGNYKLQLYVHPGRQHYYVFYVNGQRMTDPYNPSIAYGENHRSMVSTIASQGE